MISDSVAPLVASAEGSASSHSFRTVKSSQPSQVSSATLVEHLLDNHAREQSQQVKNDEHEDSGDRATGKLIQQPSPAQNMAMDVPQLNHTGQSDVLPSEAPDFEPGYHKTLNDAVIDEDKGELWKRINQGDYFSWNNCENHNALT
jgi:hypothetical protein